MKPFLLKGHDRPITQVIFNREGDLLFSSSKGKIICVWFSHNGERLGTFSGHSGAIMSIDVDDHSKLLISGSADNTARIWDVRTGKELFVIDLINPARFVQFAHGCEKFLLVTDQVMGKEATIQVYNTPSTSSNPPDLRPIISISLPGKTKVLQAHWGPLNQTIIAAFSDGHIVIFDAKSLVEKTRKKAHEGQINNLKFSTDQSHFVSASADKTSKMWDTRTLELLKTFVAGRPVNDSALSPKTCHIILGGGESAESVTVSSADSTQFRLRAFHKVFSTEVASVSAHFGPVNSITFSNDGQFLASGGEDGFIRLHHLDEEFFDLSEPLL